MATSSTLDPENGMPGSHSSLPTPHSLFWWDEYDPAHPLRSFIATSIRVIADPRRFYARLDPEGGYLSAMAFALIATAIGGALTGCVAEITVATLQSRPVATANLLGAAVYDAVIFVVMTAICDPLGFGIVHLFVRLFVGPVNRGYRGTFRVLAYSEVTSLVGWVPVVGWIVAAIWSTYMAIIGLRSMHGTSLVRAAVSVLVPTALGLGLVGASFVIAWPVIQAQLR